VSNSTECQVSAVGSVPPAEKHFCAYWDRQYKRLVCWSDGNVLTCLIHITARANRRDVCVATLQRLTMSWRVAYVQTRISHRTELYMCSSTVYCHVIDWLYTEFGLVIGFIAHLHIVTTSNCDSLTELHTPKITVTTAHINCSVVASRCLVAACNSGRSPSSGFPNCPPPQLPTSHNNWTPSVI
jgi:hypothetical protein